MLDPSAVGARRPGLALGGLTGSALPQARGLALARGPVAPTRG